MTIDLNRIDPEDFRWKKQRLSIKFFKRLVEYEGDKLHLNDYKALSEWFVLPEAYELWAEHHAKRPYRREQGGKIVTDPFMEMTVRNNICAAVYRGVLRRPAPGVYYFNPNLDCGYNFLLEFSPGERKDFPATHQEFLTKLEAGYDPGEYFQEVHPRTYRFASHYSGL